MSGRGMKRLLWISAVECAVEHNRFEIDIWTIWGGGGSSSWWWRKEDGDGGWGDARQTITIGGVKKISMPESPSCFDGIRCNNFFMSKAPLAEFSLSKYVMFSAEKSLQTARCSDRNASLSVTDQRQEFSIRDKLQPT